MVELWVSRVVAPEPRSIEKMFVAPPSLAE
jgi:hypothetical protein